MVEGKRRVEPGLSRPTLGQFWHPIATSKEVVDRPRQFLLLDETIVAYRDGLGVVALKDLCIHRGTALSLGRLQGGRLICAYHGWQYDRTGACVRIPSLPEGSSIPAKARAAAYRVTEAYGLVWVAMEQPVAAVPVWPRGEIMDPGYRTMMVEYAWNASAGRAVENFMDLSHFAFVHPGILGSEDRTLVPRHEVIEREYGLRYDIEQYEEAGPYSEAHSARREYDVHMPFTCHLTRREPAGVTVLTLIASPISKKRSKLYLFTVRNHSFEKDEEIQHFNHIVMEQDRVIVESQRPEEIPTDLREELHIKVPDAAAILYRRRLGHLE